MSKKAELKSAPETVSPELGNKFKLGDNELQRKQQDRTNDLENPGKAGDFSIAEIRVLAQSAAALSSVFKAKLPAAEESSKFPAGYITKQDVDLIVDAVLDRMYRRVPAPAAKGSAGGQCPFTGLNRGQFYELFKLRKNGKSVIRSVSLREDGETRGARFYHVGDSLRQMDRLAAEQAEETFAKT
jgi:hypothetical protein